jgi:hypothetical protein
LAQVEVIGCCLVLPFSPGRSLFHHREGIDVDPPEIGSDEPSTSRANGKYDLGRRNHMFGAVFAAASCGQSSSLIAVVVNFKHRNRFTYNEAIDRQVDGVLEDLSKGPELLVVAVGVDNDLPDRLVQGFEILVLLVIS